MNRLIKLTIFVHLLPEIDGAITLNCGAISPNFPDSVSCSCTNSAGIGVEWSEDTSPVSNCFFTSLSCSPNPIGYSFSVNQTEQMFIMTVSPYTYSDCKQFTCKDFSDISIQQSLKPSIIEFDSTMPSAIAEPALDNTDGDISITTSCISGYSDLTPEWYIFVDGSKMQYIPDQDIVIRQINTTACTACNSESAATIKVGIQHKESVDNKALEGHLQLKLSHPDYPLEPLERNTSNVYKVVISGYSGGSNGNGCELICIIPACLGTCAVVVIIIIIIVFFVKHEKKGVPGPPTEFKVVSKSVSTITVQWERGFDGGFPQTFIISCSGIENEHKVYDNKASPSLNYTLTGMKPATNYQLWIRAQNEKGTSQRSELITVNTTRGEPDPPTDVRVVDDGVTETQILLRWKPGDDGGFKQQFNLTCANEKEFKHKDRIADSGKEVMHWDWTHLSEGTWCHITIVSSNSEGYSPILEPLLVRTLGKGMPYPPKEFKVVSKSVTKSSFAVQWERGFDGGFPQTFIITCPQRIRDNENEFKHEDHNDKESSLFYYMLTGLKQATYYQLRILAKNESGTSPQSKQITVRTKGKGVPYQPKEFKVVNKSVTKSSFAVQWERGLDGGFPQTFVITCSQNDHEFKHAHHDDKESSLFYNMFTGLKQATCYQLQIFARNKRGTSRQSKQITVKTKGPPDPPKHFSVVDLKAGVRKSSIDVTWEPGFNGGFTQKFILKCFRNGHDLQKEERIPDTHQSIRHTIKELSEGTSYDLHIFSENAKGASDTFPPVTVRTNGIPKFS